MKRTIKVIAVVLAAVAVGIVAYDRSRSQEQTPWLRSDLGLQPSGIVSARADVTVDSRTTPYRVNAAPNTVISLGQTREGCTLTHALPPEAVCDLAVAFPDVGLNGSVTFVGSAHVASSTDTLTFNLGS